MGDAMEEMVSNGSGMRIPGADGYYAVNGLEDQPFPEKVRLDLETGRLRIPEGYVGGLAVVLPQEGEAGQSQVIMIVREPPEKSSDDSPEFVLPMTFMSMCTLLGATLNRMLAMPWIIKEIGVAMLQAIYALTERVDEDLNKLDRSKAEPEYPPRDL